MPKQIPATELDAIVQVVGQFPNGAAVSEVRGALDIELSRRTLQRRLARLVEAGRLETFGEGRAQRYRVSPLLEEGTPPVTRETDDDVVGPPTADVGDIQPGAEQPIRRGNRLFAAPIFWRAINQTARFIWTSPLDAVCGSWDSHRRDFNRPVPMPKNPILVGWST